MRNVLELVKSFVAHSLAEQEWTKQAIHAENDQIGKECRELADYHCKLKFKSEKAIKNYTRENVNNLISQTSSSIKWTDTDRYTDAKIEQLTKE